MSALGHLIIPLDQPIGYYLQHVYNRKIQKVSAEMQRGQYHPVNINVDWTSFIRMVLTELFSSVRDDRMKAANWIPSSMQYLINTDGFSRQEASRLYTDVSNMIMGEITLMIPDITNREIEEWQWGICEPNSLMISLPK